ncbi:MAG: tetratricopeptide repeat protein [Thermoplasmataceae archaeon]
MAVTKPNKVSRKIVTSITGFTLGEPERPSQRKFDKLIESLKEFAESAEEELDQYLLDSLYVLMESPSLSTARKREVLKIMRLSEKMNFFAAILDTEILIGEGRKKEAFEKILSDKRFAGYARVNSIIDRSITSESDFLKASVYLSSMGTISLDLFMKALGQASSRDELDEVIRNVLAIKPSADGARFIEAVYLKWKEQDTLVNLLEMLSALNQTELLNKYVADLEIDSIGSVLLRKVIETGRKMGNLEISLRAARREATLNPQGVEATMDVADILSELGRYSESATFYEKALAAGGDREVVVPRIVFTKLRMKDYSAVVDLTGSLKTMDRETLLDRITALTALSEYDSAKKDLGVYLQQYGEDSGYLEAKLDLEIILGSESSAMETAEKLLKPDMNNQKALDFIISTLYSLGEYNRLIEKYGAFENHSDSQKMLFISACISQGKIDEALKIIATEPEFCLRGQVLDAMFRTFRNDALIEKLESVNISGKPRIALSRIIKEIRGVDEPLDPEYRKLVQETDSVSLAWILAKREALGSRDGFESVNSILTRRQFVSVLAVVEFINGLDGESDLSDVRDSEFLMYPIVSALISRNRVEEAETLLQNSADPKSDDPFYLYIRALIAKHRNNRSQTRKFIDRAIEKITNAKFHSLSIQESIEESDSETMIQSLRKLVSIHAYSEIPAEEIYRFIQSEDGKEVFLEAFELLKDYEGISPWISRILAEGYRLKGDYLNSVRITESICVSEQRTLEDLLQMAAICVKLGQFERGIPILLSNEERFSDSRLELVLGDLLYFDGKLREAADHYRKSVEMGALKSSLQNYADALISLRRLKEAEKVVDGVAPNLYLKARLMTAELRIDDIRNFIGSGDIDDEDFIRGFQHITENLWENSEIRDSILKKYRTTRDYTVGVTISRSLEKFGDIRGAIETRKQLMKEYPDSISNCLELARLYELSGMPQEASTVLKKSMKFSKSDEDARKIIESAIKLYFNHGLFGEIISLYESHREYLNAENVGYVIRSYLEKNDFDTAERLMGKYHGTIIDGEKFNELNEEMDVRRNFYRITTYATRLLETEYKIGKVLDPSDAVAYAGIPVSAVDQIYNFLDEEGYYSDINEQKYELLSRDVIQRAVKKGKVIGVPDMKINVIYANLENPDIVVAKNLYIYIKKNAARKRKPDPSGVHSNRLLKVAVKNNLKANPIEIASFLKLGISDAMDIMALMEYLYSLNRIGGGA